MTDERHLMVCIGESGFRSLFECTADGCDRRVALDHKSARLTVLAPGVLTARHHGSTGLAALSGAVGAGPALPS
jgi:hypothetical protein